MEGRLETLRARRDRFLKIGKWVLLLCAVLWLASIAFYDTDADPGATGPRILLPSRLAYSLLLGGIEPLDIQRVWGGPATLFGLGSFATSLLVLGLAALARARLNDRPWSRTGAVLVLCSMPLWALTYAASGRAIYPVLVRPEAFQRLTALIEARQPGTVSTLRAGTRLALPANVGGGRRIRVLQSGEGIMVKGPDDALPIQDQLDAETLRFALAEQAYFAGDRPAVRRLLPIALAMPPADQPARNEFAQRLAAIGRFAGVPPVPDNQARWVEEGDATWAFAMRFILVNRVLIRITMLAGMLSLLIGLVLRRRVGQIERHRAETRVPIIPRAKPGFGRSNRGLTPSS
jgi:hypothetical protein